FDGPLGETWAMSAALQGTPAGEFGGYIQWALRDATAAAGYYRSAREAEAFYYRIAAEIRAAAAAGRVPTRPVVSIILDPCFENYRPYLLLNWCKLWSRCWLIDAGDLPQDSEISSQTLEDFNCVARRRAVIPTGETKQSQIRQWIRDQYGKVMNIL